MVANHNMARTGARCSAPNHRVRVDVTAGKSGNCEVTARVHEVHIAPARGFAHGRTMARQISLSTAIIHLESLAIAIQAEVSTYRPERAPGALARLGALAAATRQAAADAVTLIESRPGSDETATVTP